MAFQQDAFQQDAFQQTEALAEDAFQTCAFQQDAFQITSECDEEATSSTQSGVRRLSMHEHYLAHQAAIAEQIKADLARFARIAGINAPAPAAPMQEVRAIAAPTHASMLSTDRPIIAKKTGRVEKTAQVDDAPVLAAMLAILLDD